MEDVHGSPVDSVMLNTAHCHITIFRLPSLIREVKGKYRIENGKPFKDTDPQAKLAAIEDLEEMNVPFIPLRACVGPWTLSSCSVTTRLTIGTIRMQKKKADTKCTRKWANDTVLLIGTTCKVIQWNRITYEFGIITFELILVLC